MSIVKRFVLDTHSRSVHCLVESYSYFSVRRLGPTLNICCVWVILVCWSYWSLADWYFGGCSRGIMTFSLNRQHSFDSKRDKGIRRLATTNPSPELIQLRYIVCCPWRGRPHWSTFGVLDCRGHLLFFEGVFSFVVAWRRYITPIFWTVIRHDGGSLIRHTA